MQGFKCAIAWVVVLALVWERCSSPKSGKNTQVRVLQLLQLIPSLLQVCLYFPYQACFTRVMELDSPVEMSLVSDTEY